MNRAKRYAGGTLLFIALTAFGFGVYLGGVTMAPKPEIRTVAQSPDHTAARLIPAAQDCPSNREGQTSAATPQPYSLHPGATPLKDPTQDAYYKKLLKEGRFPTSGSSEGRPR